MRNVKKTAEQAYKICEKHPHIALSVTEVEQFREIFREGKTVTGGLLDVITTAFMMGLAVGARNSK